MVYRPCLGVLGQTIKSGQNPPFSPLAFQSVTFSQHSRWHTWPGWHSKCPKSKPSSSGVGRGQQVAWGCCQGTLVFGPGVCSLLCSATKKGKGWTNGKKKCHLICDLAQLGEMELLQIILRSTLCAWCAFWHWPAAVSEISVLLNSGQNLIQRPMSQCTCYPRELINSLTSLLTS